MGLDGFSMGNLGLNTDLTSAQLVGQAELSAQKDAEFKIKTISESEQDELVKRKEEEEESKQQTFEDGFKNNDETDEDTDETNDEADLSPSLISEKDIENSNHKDFLVRINPLTEQVELFSKKDERVLEAMPAKDLMGLVSKLNGASGILVNRKI